MIFREARLNDIPAMALIRMSVKENVLNTPGLVTHRDYEDYLTRHGKGWVCETDNKIVGFAIVGLVQKNIWALFVLPQYEARGIGRKLHDNMLNWYFSQTKENVWLGTAPNTRAEKFYLKSGWKLVGTVNKEEIKFEITFTDWIKPIKL